MNEIQHFGEYTFEATHMVVTRGIDIIDLPHKQLEALALLLNAQGEVVTREEFLDTVWKDVVVEEHNLTQTIFLLRKALGKLPSGSEYIETVPRIGYRMCLEAIHQHNLFESALSGIKSPSRQFETLPRPVVHDATPSGRRLRGYPLFAGVFLGVILVLALVVSHSHSQRPRLTAVTKLTRDGYLKVGTSPVVSYQGSIFFTELRSQWPYLASVPSEGGTVTASKLPTAGDFFFGVHPSREEALLSSPFRDASIDIGTLRGQPLRSAIAVSGHAPAWSPDGTEMVYIDQGRVLLADSAGQNPTVIASFPGTPFWTAWSPDGTTIRFSVHETAGRQSMYEIDLATRSLTPLLVGDPDEHRACCGSWSRNGEYFVYVVENSRSSSIWGRHEKLFQWKKGRASWQIASGPVDFWRAPALSEDMHHLYATGEQRRLHLTRLNHNFEPFLRDLSVESINMSHGGDWVVYTLHPEGTLWKSRADGTARVQLSAPGEFARSPQWSADDKSILYIREVNGTKTITRINAQTGAHEAEIHDYPDIERIADAPTTDKIAFERELGAGDPDDGIYIMSLPQKEVVAVPSSTGLSVPRWSPDERYLSALSEDRSLLKLFDFQTKDWQEIASADTISAQAWDPQKDFLYYLAGRGGKYVLMKYIVANGKTEEVRQMPEQYDEDYISSILETTPSGDLLFGYSVRETELYDIAINW